MAQCGTHLKNAAVNLTLRSPGKKEKRKAFSLRLRNVRRSVSNAIAELRLPSNVSRDKELKVHHRHLKSVSLKNRLCNNFYEELQRAVGDVRLRAYITSHFPCLTTSDVQHTAPITNFETFTLSRQRLHQLLSFSLAAESFLPPSLTERRNTNCNKLH
jgi:hypothetical protein